MPLFFAVERATTLSTNWISELNFKKNLILY